MFRPRLLIVARHLSDLAGLHQDLVLAGIHVDVLSSVEVAKAFLRKDLTITHVLCEDRVGDGHAEDLHQFMTDRLRHPARFLVLGSPTIGWVGRGIVTVSKPPTADVVLERLSALDRADGRREVAA